MGGHLHQPLPVSSPVNSASDITSAEVIQFWQYMQSQYHFTVINKADSTAMQLVSKLLSLLGIVNQTVFQQQFTTTIGQRIYVPFTVGVPDSNCSLWDQVEVCTHECQHIHQYLQSGATEFAWNYVTDHVRRAQYEAEAYFCNLELWWWRCRYLLNCTALAGLLNNYGCTATDIAVTAKRLQLSGLSVKTGAVVQFASHSALTWLNHNVPRLHATG